MGHKKLLNNDLDYELPPFDFSIRSNIRHLGLCVNGVNIRPGRRKVGLINVETYGLNKCTSCGSSSRSVMICRKNTITVSKKCSGDI